MDNGDYIAGWDDHDTTRREIYRHSPKDAEAYDEYGRRMARLAKAIKPILSMLPPDPTSLHPKDLMGLMKLGQFAASLTEETDRLGLRRVGLDWRLGELEKHTMEVAAGLLAEEVGRLGLGRVRLHEWLTDDSPEIEVKIAGGYHHMGTTRMASDPQRGVVDADCLVHGTENLYVAGSSVFPAVGFANPTLTIVELTLRLADHLEQRLASAA
jgi:choline dehydrogenase-like flavoprotein